MPDTTIKKLTPTAIGVASFVIIIAQPVIWLKKKIVPEPIGSQ